MRDFLCVRLVCNGKLKYQHSSWSIRCRPRHSLTPEIRLSIDSHVAFEKRIHDCIMCSWKWVIKRLRPSALSTVPSLEKCPRLQNVLLGSLQQKVQINFICRINGSVVVKKQSHHRFMSVLGSVGERSPASYIFCVDSGTVDEK
jgi:hypothetical protein